MALLGKKATPWLTPQGVHTLLVSITMFAILIFLRPDEYFKGNVRVLATVPTQAYLIAMKGETVRYSFSMKQLHSIGLDKVKRVDGQVLKPDVYAHDTRGKKKDVDLKIGLTLAHMEIWKDIIKHDISAAWVFEDDVVFHDDWAQIFPEYWKQVPHDFDFIWVGACPQTREQHRHPVVTAPQEYPWCTHAYIVSKRMAELLVLNAEYKLLRASPPVENSSLLFSEQFATSWALDEFDICSDNLIGSQYRYLTPAADKHRWVVFENAPEYPARWLGATWVLGNQPNSHCICVCDAADRQKCVKEGQLPVRDYVVGLAYQQRCVKDPSKLTAWKDEAAAYMEQHKLASLPMTCEGQPM